MNNLCKRCYHNYVCEQYNENRDLTRTKCDYKNSHFVDATDVIPVRHGSWLDGKCTVCGWEEPDVGTWDGYDAEAWIETPYCPNCGAIMDGGRL